MSSSTIEIDGYENAVQIGKGGFSRVYRARQRDFDREVAIKVLDVGLDERQREAFKRECRAMGVVSQHPNIVTVLSATFTADGKPAIVMELYGGGTYADRVMRDGPMPGGEVLELGIRVCGALQTAHDRGLLHRDVKPTNLFVSDFGEPALGDFGISSFDGEEVEGSGLTMHYAAPEVIEYARSSPASDVYSLAATLYTLVAGRRPFTAPGQGQRSGDLALRILSEAPARIGGNCPPQLERAILQGMAKRPEDRPASAASFGRLLQAAQEGMGSARTELAVAQTPGKADDTELTIRAPGMAPSGEHDAETATVARPVTSSSRKSGDGETTDRSASPARRWLSVGVGTVAVAALAAITMVAIGGQEDPEPETADPAAPADADDDFFVQAIPPTGIEVERLDDETVAVRWEPADGARYQVQRVDAAGDDVVETDVSEVVLDIEADARPCVVVRTVAPNGRISADSSVSCLNG